MPDNQQKGNYTCIRVPRWLKEELEEMASDLEETIANTTSMKQQSKIVIEGGLHERFGVVAWKIVHRLVRDHKLKLARQQRYREKKRKQKWPD